MITIEQCRAARGLLGWTQQDLAEASGLSKTAINNFEKGHSDIKAESLRAIRMAFESADIEFIGDAGLQKRSEHAEILRGPNAFPDLLDDIFDTLKDGGGEVLVYNPDEHIARQTRPKKLLEHMERLKEHKITERVICAEGRSSILSGGDSSCRHIPRLLAENLGAMFIYGPKVAIQLWDHSLIVVIASQGASAAERRRFEVLWSRAAPAAGDDTADPVAGTNQKSRG